METGRASKTAFRVALRRAVHQVLDQPHVLHDPIAVPLLGSQFAFDPLRERHPIARAFRAFMAARSRYAEDRLAESVAQGVAQYVILGAGLDTFAYRNPFPHLRVFEVDFPATQAWKRRLLSEARIAEPANLTFVPLDFEHRTLAQGLSEAGFDLGKPAFFGWLGVVPYLTLEAFRSTLKTIARLPAGAGVSFDYGLSPQSLASAWKVSRHVSARRRAISYRGWPAVLRSVKAWSYSGLTFAERQAPMPPRTHHPLMAGPPHRERSSLKISSPELSHALVKASSEAFSSIAIDALLRHGERIRW